MKKCVSYQLETKEIRAFEEVSRVLLELATVEKDFIDDTGAEYSDFYIAQLHVGIAALSKGSVFTIKN